MAPATDPAALPSNEDPRTVKLEERTARAPEEKAVLRIKLLFSIKREPGPREDTKIAPPELASVEVV